ncbi:MAG: hypothetical protein WBV82_10395 [Myxococcaceae bacterium]
MKYCTVCGSEYQDSVTTCADDGNTELVSAEEMHARGLPTVEERDTRRFVRAGTAEDPLTAERYTAVLSDRRIPVFARPRRSGTVDIVTSGAVHPWWEILVPEEFAEQAAAFLNQARAELDASSEDAARAAEEEERETEAQTETMPP